MKKNKELDAKRKNHLETKLFACGAALATRFYAYLVYCGTPVCIS